MSRLATLAATWHVGVAVNELEDAAAVLAGTGPPAAQAREAVRVARALLEALVVAANEPLDAPPSGG